MSERIIFHVDMNAFFASVEQQCNPTLRGKPIAVCGSAQHRTVVAACSYEAKAFGINNGMSLGEAKQLCPHVILVGGDPNKYVDVAQHLFALMGHFTSELEVFSIDEAWLDMTDTYDAFASTPEGVAQLIKQRIRAAYGLTCSIGIAPNKLLAKVASKLRKPDGLVRIRKVEVPAFMEQLPIESLCGVGPKLKAALNDFDIFTCGELGRAPSHFLARRYGLVGQSLIRMGRGEDESPVIPVRAEVPAKSMSHAYTLPYDTADEEEVAGTMLRLSEQVARRLRQGGCQGRTVGLTIRYADWITMTHHETLAYPTDNGYQVYEAAMALYHARCGMDWQRVRLVGVGVSSLIHRQRQLSFLEDDLQRERVDQCLDRAWDRFGDFTLVRASAMEPLVSKTHGFLLGSQRSVSSSADRDETTHGRDRYQHRDALLTATV